MSWLRKSWAFLVETYATADPRSLGLFRIFLGSLLFYDIVRRLPDLDHFYSNSGVLANHFAIFRPMSSHLFSLYHAFSTPAEVKVLFAIHLIVAVLFIVGWRTKLMHFLSALLIISLNSRTIMLENGGWVVLNELTVWSLFLPLGRRFSVDAFLASLRAWKETEPASLNEHATPERATTPVKSLAVTALIAQWVVIYAFNVIHKNGPQWMDGSAVYYFFKQDRMVTPLGAWVRDHLPDVAYTMMTYSTLVIESIIAVLLVVPTATRHTRMIAMLLAFSLHGVIDAVVQLGPFSWAMIFVFIVFIPASYWEWLLEWARNRAPRRAVCFDAADGFSVAACRVIKRFDLLGRVTFVPVRVSEDESESLPGSLTPEEVGRNLVVVDSAAERHYVGRAALERLGDALPLPRAVVWLLARFPGVEGLVRRSVRRRDELTQSFAVPLGDPEEPPVSERGIDRSIDRAKHRFATVCVGLLIVATGSQVLMENRAIPEPLKPKKRPEWMTALVVYPRLFQGWSMFAPGPPTDDGRLVVDGRTADGRRLDPLTNQEPSWEVQPKDGFRMNQIWGDFHRRIGEPRFQAYLHGVRDYLRNRHRLTGKPEDQLVSFEVWMVREIIPPPGRVPPTPTRHKLITFGVVRDPTPFPYDTGAAPPPKPKPRPWRRPPPARPSASPAPVPAPPASGKIPGSP